MLAILNDRITRNKEETMEKRRHFLKFTFRFFTGMGIVLGPFFQAVRMVYAKAQKIIWCQRAGPAQKARLSAAGGGRGLSWICLGQIR
jgi:hypothetical protein